MYLFFVVCKCIREKLTMTSKQQRIDFAFISITRDEMAVEIEKEFSSLD
jgi:hypothetical protein